MFVGQRFAMSERLGSVPIGASFNASGKLTNTDDPVEKISLNNTEIEGTVAPVGFANYPRMCFTGTSGWPGSDSVMFPTVKNAG